MADVPGAGCPDVLYVPFRYEPSLHFPDRARSDEEGRLIAADVVFIGGRRESAALLAERMPDLQLHLYGGYRDRRPPLRKFHRGYALGGDYRLALSGTRIAPCFVRKAKRDGHAMRIFEIPACVGFMSAERTNEHQELFGEGTEADFFESSEELADKVDYYLKHESQGVRIAGDLAVGRFHRQAHLPRQTARDLRAASTI